MVKLFCSSCGQEIDKDRQVCPKCSVGGTTKSTLLEKNPGDGIANGFSKSVVPGAMFFLIGTLFVFLGIFKFIGWMLIIGGIVLPFIGVFSGFQNQIKGVCPYCDCKINDIPQHNAINCKSCKNQVIIKDGRLWTIAK